MKKRKYLLIGAIVFILLFSASSSLAMVDSNKINYIKESQGGGPELEVTTDKTAYEIGEMITIFFTNIGDETLSGGGPIVAIYNNEDEIVYQEACYCWWELEPGEYEEWLPWDQTNKQGNQVPIGEYTVEGFLSGNEQNYVDTTTFYINGDNSPPNPPEITIPDTIIVGKWFKIKMVTTDPDGDDLFYRVDCPGISDFWWGPFPSGIVYDFLVKLKIPPGAYTLGVQAKDIHEAESDWTYVQFNVTKSKAIQTPFLQFLEQHPILFQLLQRFLNL